jgi:hypothetical protein
VPGNGGPPRFADPGHAAAHDDHVGIEQVHDVREREAILPGRGIEDRRRGRVARGERRRQAAGARPAGRRLAGQRPVRIRRHLPGHLPVERPSRGHVLERRAAGRDPQVTDLHLARHAAVIDLA